MKYISIFILVFLVGSCHIESEFQVVTTNSDLPIKNEYFVSENKDVELSYDFWSKRGILEFKLYNKNDKPIYIDFDKCHFIVNGISYEYFNNEEYSNTDIISAITERHVRNKFIDENNTVSDKRTTAFQSGNSSIWKMKRILEVPSKSAIIVNKFKINFPGFYDCDLKKAINIDKANSRSFDKASSPFVFRNYITYSLTPQVDNQIIVDNSFWVEKVTNMTKDAFYGKSIDYKECPDDAVFISKWQNPYKNPKNFWLHFDAR